MVLLVRHGQAAFGTDHYDRLSERGRQQARWLGEHLAALGVSEIVFDVRSASMEETLARMDGFAKILRETASV